MAVVVKMDIGSKNWRSSLPDHLTCITRPSMYLGGGKEILITSESTKLMHNWSDLEIRLAPCFLQLVQSPNGHRSVSGIRISCRSNNSLKSNITRKWFRKIWRGFTRIQQTPLVTYVDTLWETSRQARLVFDLNLYRARCWYLNLRRIHFSSEQILSSPRSQLCTISICHPSNDSLHIRPKNISKQVLQRVNYYLCPFVYLQHSTAGHNRIYPYLSWIEWQQTKRIAE